jgi:hydroxymethylbilane synthase
MSVLRIGTRGSALALAQANWVKERLESPGTDLRVEVAVIKTRGDRFVETAIQAIGGKGLFTKEIEEALLHGEIDVAVHSMKDLPTDLPDGLMIAAVPEREDPRDVLVTRNRARLDELPAGARIGTGSLRRRSQILHHRPDLRVIPIRGNVDTRLKKLESGEVDGLVMAAAGLNRIGRSDRIAEMLPPEICVSAVAQGALALQTRRDHAVCATVAVLHHHATATEVAAERSFLRRAGGGCLVPVGARAFATGESLRIIGVIGDPDGHALFRGEKSAGADVTAETGAALADELLGQGADRILASLERQESVGNGES